ncbi:hypothetical protein [Thalassolituus oleivorans]|uniref:hypothetical protein n=1 Tax=Thalassolituus oleivorans TaxID=187493 RepID=UPI0023F3025F|nr:hypothetical protein [Thalassolituus oleivorans]
MPDPVIHLFKPGTHIDMGGQQIDFSESDLTASVNAYDPELHEAPLVIGHPEHDAPAYGWVRAMKMAADGPEAIPHQVNADFAEMHKTGAFKKVSASFYTPTSPHNPVPGVYYLRHVAFLGAQPPAIKGLRAPQLANFSEADECITVEFSEGLPAVDEPATTTPTPATPTTEEDTTVTEAEAAALAAKNKQLEADLLAEKTARAKDAADQRAKENVAFAEKLATETRIGKDEAPLIAAVLTTLENAAAATPVNFGEGDAAKPLHKAFADSLQAQPTRVEFAEIVTKEKGAEADADDSVQYAEGTSEESIALDKKIRAHMKAHSVDYTTAAHAVAK